MRLKTSRAAIGLGLALVLTTAACGKDDSSDSTKDASQSSGGSDSAAAEEFAKESPEDILTAVGADMKKLKEVRMAGDLSAGGQDITFDFQVTTDADCMGTISLGKGTAELVAVGGTAYMKPDEEFWSAVAPSNGAEIAKTVGDRWVSGGSADQLKSLCDLNGFLSELSPEKAKGGKVTGTGEVDGDSVVILESPENGGSTVVVSVLGGSPHYLRKLEIKGDPNGDGLITFSDFDDIDEIKAPSPDDVIDYTKLAG